MADPGWTLLLSCEHAGNLVPDPWQRLFAGAEAALESHRGYDLGIGSFARWLAEELRVPLQLNEVTRLLVEFNRSLGHPALFSEFSRSLGSKERQALLERYYYPYRAALEQRIDQALEEQNRVCHVSLHSFTPQWHGELRNADIGLLYDPRRREEKVFCLEWQANISRQGGGWRVRRNYPYRGAADSIVTLLRRRFPAERYLGLELELNQAWPLQGGARWTGLQVLIRDTLKESLNHGGKGRLRR
jgi:predicted N-formylglutamate amidohydrolase